MPKCTEDVWTSQNIQRAPEHRNFCKEHCTGACAENIDRAECILEKKEACASEDQQAYLFTYLFIIDL